MLKRSFSPTRPAPVVARPQPSNLFETYQHNSTIPQSSNPSHPNTRSPVKEPGHNPNMTSSADTVELLSKTTIAAGMTREQIEVLAGCGSLETIGHDEPLVSSEETQFDLLVVLEGGCEIRTSMNDVLSKLGPDSLIGEVSFLDHRPRSAKAIACGDCKIMRFPASLLDDLEATRPDIVARLLKNIGVVLCQKLRSTTRFAEASFV